jgi:hypothetical protein
MTKIRTVGIGVGCSRQTSGIDSVLASSVVEEDERLAIVVDFPLSWYPQMHRVGASLGQLEALLKRAWHLI